MVDPVMGHLQGKINEIAVLPVHNQPGKRQIRISFDKDAKIDKLVPESELAGKVILSDVPVLVKFLRSVGINIKGKKE